MKSTASEVRDTFNQLNSTPTPSIQLKNARRSSSFIPRLDLCASGTQVKSKTHDRISQRTTATNSRHGINKEKKKSAENLAS